MTAVRHARRRRRLRLRPVSLIALVATAAAAAGCRDAPPPPPAPRPSALVELAAEATAGLVAAEDTSELAIRVRVSAGRLPGGQRPPLNLVLVVDTSGSMAGASIEHARAAARELVGHVTARDRVAVVAFHSGAEVVVPSVPGDPVARAWADYRLGRLEARGTTDLAGGLALGLQQVALGRQPGSIDRLVLVGDGVPNDATALPSLVEQARSSRVAVTTLGLGVEFDEDLLGRIALDTGGAYHFVDDAAAVAAIFDDELVRLRQVVARNVVLTLQPGPGVTLAPTPGVEPAGAAQVAYLGDLAAGEVRDVIVPLRAQGRRDGAAVELADVVLTFDDAVGDGGALVRRGFVAATASRDLEAVAASVKLPLEAAHRRAAAASAILEAIRQARGGDVAGGLARLDAAEKATREAAATTGDTELAALADRMVELRRNLAQVAVASIDPAVRDQLDELDELDRAEDDGRDPVRQLARRAAPRYRGATPVAAEPAAQPAAQPVAPAPMAAPAGATLTQAGGSGAAVGANQAATAPAEVEVQIRNMHQQANDMLRH